MAAAVPRHGITRNAPRSRSLPWESSGAWTRELRMNEPLRPTSGEAGDEGPAGPRGTGASTCSQTEATCPASRRWTQYCCPGPAPPGEMPIIDQVFMSPFEKWFRYRRFPWAFVVHSLLLVLVTLQAIGYFARDVQHVSRTARHFAMLFVGERHKAPHEMNCPQDLRTTFETAQANYFSINDLSFVNYDLDTPDRMDVLVTWRNESEEVISLGPGQKLPLLYDQELLPLLSQLYIEHRLKEKPRGSADCEYDWTIQVSFDGGEAGVFKGIVECHAKDCQPEADAGGMAFAGLVFLFSSASLVLVIRKLRRFLRTIRRLKARPEVWSLLSWSDIIALFSPWWGCTLLMSISQLVFCALCGLLPQPDIGTRFQYVGLTCFLTWYNMIQYFESFPGYYHAFLTLRICLASMLKFLVSVLSLFAAFALLGVCLFWQSPMFNSPSKASSSLFSLLNGDTLLDSFNELYQVRGLLGHLYLYVFLILFIFVILNVNIGIITDAYEETKQLPQKKEKARRKQRQALARAMAFGTEEDIQDARASLPSAAAGVLSPQLRQLTPVGPGREGAAPTTQPDASRRTSTTLQYMSPRFFDSVRIQQALTAAFPERPSESSPRMAMVVAGGDGDQPSSAPGSFLMRSSTPPGSNGRTWQEFDLGIEGLQAAAQDERLLLAASDEHGEIASALQGVRNAVERFTDARRRAGMEEEMCMMQLPPALDTEDTLGAQ